MIGRLAVLQLAAEDRAAYQLTCQHMLQSFGHDERISPEEAEGVAKSCSLAPDAVVDFEPVRKLAQRALHDRRSTCFIATSCWPPV